MRPSSSVYALAERDVLDEVRESLDEEFLRFSWSAEKYSSEFVFFRTPLESTEAESIELSIEGSGEVVPLAAGGDEDRIFVSGYSSSNLWIIRCSV